MKTIEDAKREFLDWYEGGHRNDIVDKAAECFAGVADQSARPPEILTGPCELGPGVWVIHRPRGHWGDDYFRSQCVIEMAMLRDRERAIRLGDIPIFPPVEPPAPVMPAGPKPVVEAWRHKPSGKVFWGYERGGYVHNCEGQYAILPLGTCE